jgi:DNA-binding MarR family transcriptional regulator
METREHETSLPAGLVADLGWLLAKALRAHAQVRDATLAGFPGGPRGYLVLQGAANNCAHKQIELARYLGIDRTVMVYLIDDLVKAGLVERRPDPSDRRNRLIVVTAQGEQRLATVTTELVSRDDVLLAPLTTDERDGLRDMLRRVTAHAVGGDVEFTPGEACGTVEAVATDESC